jgi:hypothetical protein
VGEKRYAFMGFQCKAINTDIVIYCPFSGACIQQEYISRKYDHTGLFAIATLFIYRSASKKAAREQG